jgi:Concanavalin A-like lectin/glucanases superfamily
MDSGARRALLSGVKPMHFGKSRANQHLCTACVGLCLLGCGSPTLSATQQIGPAEVDYPDQWYLLSDPRQVGLDHSGNHREALAVGVVSTEDATRGWAALFNGGGLVFVPQMRRNFTIGFWLKGTQLGPDSASWSSGPRIINGDVPGVHLDFNLSLTLDKLAMGCGNPGDAAADSSALESQRSVVDGSWHHVALTRDGDLGVWSLFVDGLLDATRTGATGDLTLPDTLSFGVQGATNPPTPALQAEISDARTYSRVLSSHAIAFLAAQ